MTFLRPEAKAALLRWREVIAAVVFAAAGVWIIGLGGYFFGALGGVIVATGAGLGFTAQRRMRFARAPTGPGVVEIDEGQVGWFGPGIGGFVSLTELTDLGLVTVAGLRCWRLKQEDGQLLLIPVAATGAERLFDAFAALPGMDPTRLLAALEAEVDHPFVWRRTRAPALSRPRLT